MPKKIGLGAAEKFDEKKMQELADRTLEILPEHSRFVTIIVGYNKQGDLEYKRIANMPIDSSEIILASYLGLDNERTVIRNDFENEQSNLSPNPKSKLN